MYKVLITPLGLIQVIDLNLHERLKKEFELEEQELSTLKGKYRTVEAVLIEFAEDLNMQEEGDEADEEEPEEGD